MLSHSSKSNIRVNKSYEEGERIRLTEYPIPNFLIIYTKAFERAVNSHESELDVGPWRRLDEPFEAVGTADHSESFVDAFRQAADGYGVCDDLGNRGGGGLS